MANRIYDQGGLGKAIGDGVFEGLKYKNERKDRKFDELYKQAMAAKDAQEFGYGKYQKPTIDENGNVNGYESDDENRAKALDFVRRRLPGYPKTAGGLSSGSPATTIKPYQQSMQESGLDPATGEASAPQGPAPLLENPNKAKAETDAQKLQFDMSKGVLESEEADKSRAHEVAMGGMANAQADKTRDHEVSEADKDRQQAELNAQRKAAESQVSGVGAAQEYSGSDGKNYKVKPVSSQKATFDDLAIVGDSPQEAQGVDPSMINSTPPPLPIDVPAQEPDPLDVDNYTLKRLVDLTTTPSVNKDGVKSQMINSSQLTPEMQRKLGVEGLAIDLPFSFVARGIQNGNAAASKDIPAETYDAVAELEAGVPYSTVARKLSVAYGGKVPPQVAAELKSARMAVAQGQQHQTMNQARDEAQAEKRTDKQDKALERFRTAYDKTGILSAIAPLETLEKETGVVSGKNVKESKLPGQGTNALRALPIVGNLAATLAAKNYGGQAAQQALQALVNADIKTNSGQAVTKYEEGRNLIKTGIGPGGDEKDVTRGIQLMVKGLKEAGTSVRAGFPGEIISEYKRNGGSLPEMVFGPTGDKGGMDYNIDPKIPEASRKRIEAAKKLGINQQKLDTIAAPDVKVKKWADDNGLPYDQAERILRSRGYGK